MRDVEALCLGLGLLADVARGQPMATRSFIHQPPRGPPWKFSYTPATGPTGYMGELFIAAPGRTPGWAASPEDAAAALLVAAGILSPGQRWFSAAPGVEQLELFPSNP